MPLQTEVEKQTVDSGVPEQNGEPAYTIRITLERSQVQPPSEEDRDYPAVIVFGIEVEKIPESGQIESWPESFTMPGEVYAFCRGFQAAATMMGKAHVSVPGIRGILI